MTILEDFRELSIKKLSSNDIRENIWLHEKYKKRSGGSHIAVVVSSPVELGLMRMWAILAEDSFPQHRVFYTINDALIWLTQEATIISPMSVTSLSATQIQDATCYFNQDRFDEMS